MNLNNLFTTKTRNVELAGNYHKNITGWLGSMMGTSKAGTEVTLTTAQKHTAVMSCYAVLAESLAMMPVNLMRRTLNDGKRHKERAYDHRLYNILNLQPNDEMTQYDWIESVCMNLVSRGNAYTQIIRDQRNEIIGFYPLLTDNMEIVRLEDGELAYKYKSDFLKTTVLLYKNEILHFKYRTLDGIHGLSPIAYSRHTIGLSIALEEHGSKHFSNGILGSGVFETPAVVSTDNKAEMREQLTSRYSSLDNASKFLILEQGMTYKPISIPNNDRQYLESREFQKAEIASIFRVPPHMINLLNNATFSNIEHQGIAFTTNTMTPLVKRIEQPLNIALQQEDKELYVSLNMDALQRGDINTRYTANGQAIRDGWKTRNEVRIKEGLNPLDGLDDPILPLNMGKDDGIDGKKEEE
jgi:HK97 family phage portal protein